MRTVTRISYARILIACDGGVTLNRDTGPCSAPYGMLARAKPAIARNLPSQKQTFTTGRNGSIADVRANYQLSGSAGPLVALFAAASAPQVVVAGTDPAPRQGALSTFGQDRIPDGSGVDMHHVRRRGAETDNSPTARQMPLHLDSQVAHAGFAQGVSPHFPLGKRLEAAQCGT
jgi:hypothetical protein